MNIIDRAKTFLSTLFNEEKISSEKEIKPTIIPQAPNLLPLTVYETRRPEIKEGEDSIEGIFYIYEGKLIPDFHSECLLCNSFNNPNKKDMYHMHFFPNYMCRKFTGLSRFGEKSIPRGRVHFTLLRIDSCYAEDKQLLTQIKELYRLPDNFRISTDQEYECSNCYGKAEQSSRTYDTL
ncbi:hypothetical protein LJC58_09120 [Lachnospiraceae bacterium OttesenSCG-928-D06]|nr:hypothetical protein [Lachnospiraceae bacterium OttesenSCG-928-D06]